jgi:small-conductance mechanosensitive channel
MENILGYFRLTESGALNALVLFLAFAVLAKAADIVMHRLLRRLSRSTRTSLDESIIDILRRPVFLTILIIGAEGSASFMEPPDRLMFYIHGAFSTFLVLIWCVAAVRLSNLATERALTRIADITGLGKDVIPFLERLWKVLIILAGLTAALSIWKVNITPLLASAGIVGVAVALAAKDTLSNFFGGVSIFFDRPYKTGDYIVLDSGERGEVMDIGMRSTRIKTRDDILISVPNSIIANTKVINESAPAPNFRVRIPVGVAYGSDISQVEGILLELALKNENVLPEPPPRVRFRQFGDSALNFELLCWAKEPAMRGLTIHELNSSIYRKFTESGITFPFPQRDVHLYHKA